MKSTYQMAVRKMRLARNFLPVGRAKVPITRNGSTKIIKSEAIPTAPMAMVRLTRYFSCDEKLSGRRTAKAKIPTVAWATTTKTNPIQENIHAKRIRPKSRR